MRESKFRAWDLGVEQMYGWDTIKQFFRGHVEHKLVVVMQYTGLTDKDDKEVYEADILHICSGNVKNIAEVTFDDGCFCVTGHLGDQRTYPLKDFLWRGYDVEVIGNRFENPELMEQFI
ncbi:YopX family protein [Bacillus cereus group sp. IBL03679]|uniref:YopX family protein n=1 Tax=Bacillus cereus group sp. IBL03679 TaxID=3240095 RepID=UPI003D2F62D8